MASSDPKTLAAEALEAENRGDTRKASELYAAAALLMRREERHRDARALLKKAIQHSPHSGRLYIQMALVENDIGNDEQALLAMEKFSDLALHRNKVEQYRPYLEKQLADFPTLRQVFYRRLLELDRTNAAPFIAYAEASLEKGDWEQAKEMLVDALNTRTEETQVLDKLRTVLEKMGREDSLGALESYVAGRLSIGEFVPLLSSARQSQTEAPPDSEGQSGGEDLDSLIRKLEADLGINLQPRHDNVRPLIDEFRRRSEKIIRKDTKTRIDLAISFFEMGLVEDARDELGKVPFGDARYLEAQALIGQILYEEGSFLEALGVYQACLRDERAGPDLRDEARYRIVLIHERLGDEAQALKFAKELEQRSPTYRDIRQVKKGLEEKVRSKGR